MFFLNLAKISYSFKLYDQAICYGEKGIAEAKETGNQHGEMDACLFITKVYSDLKQYDEAIKYAKMGLDIAKKIRDKETENETSFLLGETYFKLKQYEEAVVFFDVCNKISEKTGDKDRQMKNLWKLEEVYEFLTDANYRKAKMDNYMELSAECYKMGQNTEAIEYGRKCLVIAKEIGDKYSQMSACLVIGLAHVALRQYVESVRYTSMCLDISKETEDKYAEMVTYLVIGQTLLALKKYDESFNYANLSLDISKTDDKQKEMDAYFVIVQAQFALKHYEESFKCAKMTLDISKAFRDKYAEMITYLFIGQTQLALNHYDDSIQYTNMCLDMAKETGDKKTENKTSFLLGETYFKLKQYEEAVRYFEMCNDISEETGDKDRQMKARLKLAEVYEFLLDVKYREAKMNNYMEIIAECYKMSRNIEAIHYGKKCLVMANETGKEHEEMNACLVIQKAYSALEQYDEAIPYAKKCIVMANKIGDEETENETWFLLGETYFKLKQYEEAIHCFEMCSDISQKTNDKERKMQACFKLEEIYKFLTDVKYREAKMKNYMELSVKCNELGDGMLCTDFVKENGNGHAELNACFVPIRKVYSALEQYNKAINYAEMCLNMAKKTEDKEKENKILFLLGETYIKLKQYEEGIRYFEMCYEISKETGNKEIRTKTCFELAKAHNFLPVVKQNRSYRIDDLSSISHERFHKVMFYCKECTEIAEKTGDKEIEMKASHLLGTIYQMKGNYDDAVLCYERSIDIAKEIGNKEKEVVVASHLANLYKVLNRNEEAKSQAKRAYNIAKELNDLKGNNEELFQFITLDNLLNIENDAKNCVNKFFSILESDSDVCLMMIQNTGLIQEKFCKYLQLRYNDQFFGNFLGDTISSFAAEGMLDVQRKVLVASINDRNFVTSRLEKFPWVGQVKDEIEKAPIGFYCFNLFKEMLRFVPGSDLEAFVQRLKGTMAKFQYQNKLRIPAWYVRLLLIGKEIFYDSLHALKLVDVLDYIPQYHLMIGMMEYLLEENLNAIRSLKESISCFESIFKNLHVDKSKIYLIDKYVDAYKLLSKIYIEEGKKEEALLESECCRSRSMKDILVLKYGMEQDMATDDGGHIQFTDIQSLASTNKFSILFYSLCFNDLHTFLIDGKDLQFSSQQPLQCCSTCDLEQYIKESFVKMNVRHVVNRENFNQDTEISQETKETSAQKCSDFRFRGEPSENSDESSLTSTLEVLHKKLLGEVSIVQEEVKEIVVIPDGPLFKVPFAALRDPDTGCYLSENRNIRLAPSLTTLKLFSDRREDFFINTGALVIGDPAVGKVNLNGVETEVPPLRDARGEALGIAGSLGVTALIGSAATKTSVIEKLQQGEYSVVHIAAHGDLDKATILLAPTPESRKDGKIPDEEDYMLTMADVQKAQVRAQLVVLSCCYSGRGEIRAEGVVGMCRAFLASGARAVVASLWNIDDKATNEFMTIFYCNLKGKSASTSLHLTINEMRANPVYKEPKYWAPFFLMGDDVTIKFDSIRQS